MKTFQDYWKSLNPEQKVALSMSSGVAVTYLSNIANGHRNAGRITIGKLMAADKNLSFSMFIEPISKKAS